MRQPQRVTAHLRVISHAVGRLVGQKAPPVAPLAQQQQPVVAQAVFLIRARVALQEGVHLGGLRQRQARFQLPVIGPRLQRMARRQRQQGRKLRPVTLAEGGAHLHDDGVGGAKGLRAGRAGRIRVQAGLRPGQGSGQRQQQCQNLSHID